MHALKKHEDTLAEQATIHAELLAENEELRVKASRIQRLEALLGTLPSSSSSKTDGGGGGGGGGLGAGSAASPRELQEELVAVNRRLVVYEVNEKRLARRYNLLLESERALRRRLDEDAEDKAAESKAYKMRVLYLELWRKGNAALCERLQGAIAGMVPADSHEKLTRRHAELRERYRDLLVREAELTSENTRLAGVERELKESEVKLHTVRADLGEVDAVREHLEEEMGKWKAIAAGRGGAGVAGDEDGGDRVGSLEAMVEQVARYRGDAARLEIVFKSQQKKAEVLQERVNELLSDAARTEKRLNAAQATSRQAREELQAVKASMADLRDKWDGGCSAAQRKVMESRISSLEERSLRLGLEADRQRELSDIAAAQVAAMEARKQSQRVEAESLQEQLRELAAQGDDAAIIGRQAVRLTQLQVSYKQFVRKFEVAKIALRKESVERQRLEEALDAKDGAMQRVRAEARATAIALRGALGEARAELAQAVTHTITASSGGGSR